MSTSKMNLMFKASIRLEFKTNSSPQCCSLKNFVVFYNNLVACCAFHEECLIELEFR